MISKLKEIIKTNFKKNKIYILAFLVIWVVTVSVVTFLYKDTLGKASTGNAVYDSITYFNNNEVTQNVDTIDGTKTISLFLSITEKDNSNIYVKVIGNESGTIYGEKRIKDRRIQNDSYNAVVLDYPLDSSKDKTINISIVSENENKDNLGIWHSKKSVFGDGRLTVNGEQIEGSITCKFVTDSVKFATFSNLIISFCTIGGLIIVLILLLLEPKKECLYALLTLYLGLVFLIIITPISGPDEDYHYKQTLILSNKIIGKENAYEIEDLYLDYEGFTTQTNNGAAYNRIIDTLNKPLEDLNGRPIVKLDKSSVYSYTLVYIPQALGITIGRIFRMNFLNTYYIGRFFGLLFYTLCVYISVKNTSALKDAFGLVATLPMFIQQAITYTQDAWICALSMVIFAYFLKWKFTETRISKKDYLIALGAVLLLSPSKYIYSLLATLFFFIPKERFGGIKQKIVMVAFFFAPVVYAVGGNIVSRIKPIIDQPQKISKTTGEVLTMDEMLDRHPNFSIRYILQNPMKTVQIVLNTIKTRTKTWVCTAVGRALSGGTLLIPLEIVYGFMIVFISAALQKEDWSLPISNKIYIVAISLCVAGLVLATMLVGWTRYDDPIIQGVQGRYFSPLIIYLLAVINNKRVYLPKKIDKYLILAQLLLSFVTIICVLSFTFVN